MRRRAALLGIRAEHATVARPRPEQPATPVALVEVEARGVGHPRDLRVSAIRARDRGDRTFVSTHAPVSGASSREAGLVQREKLAPGAVGVGLVVNRLTV